MRISGALLLIFGCFLTLTIVWAAVGFLMMSFGLICLLVAERRQNRIVLADAHRPTKSPRPKKSLVPGPTSASMVRHGDVSQFQLEDTAHLRGGASQPVSSPNNALASHQAAFELERSRGLDDQYPIHATAPDTSYMNRPPDLRRKDELLLPAMVSLLAEAIRKKQGPNSSEPQEASRLTYDHLDGDDRQWIENAAEPIDPSIHAPPHAISTVAAQVNDTETKGIDDAEQLIKLLNQMSEPRRS